MLSQLYDAHPDLIPIVWNIYDDWGEERYLWYPGDGYVPWIITGGDIVPIYNSYASYESAYQQIFAVDSPLEISLDMGIDQNLFTISAHIEVTNSITTTNNKIFFALTKYIVDAQADYEYKVIAYSGEMDFSLTNIGDILDQDFSFELNPNWNVADLNAVVIVQPYSNPKNILQAATATYPLIAPNPIANLEMEMDDTVTVDLTDYFYYQGNPVAADISVQSSDPSIVEAVLDGTDLTLTTFNNGGDVQIDILGTYDGYNIISSFGIYVINPSSHYVIVLDLDPTSTGAALQSSIENFYQMGDVNLTNDINAIPLNSNTDAVFVLLGVYSNNYVLTEAEASQLASYLNNGGNVYMEGADTWHYDTQTSVHEYFNIDTVGDGDSNLAAINGYDFLDGMAWSYSGEPNYIDRLVPIAPAVTIFSEPGVEYDCGVAYDSGTYKTIGTSFEITGLGGNNSLDDAVSGIIDFFEIGGFPLFPPQNVIIDPNTGAVSWDPPEPHPEAELQGYNIYFEETFLAFGTENSFLMTGLINGVTYTIGISAVYDIGESDIVEVQFTYSGTGAESGIVAVTELTGNYPNPFNPCTTIEFSIEQNEQVELIIYNLKGQKVKDLSPSLCHPSGDGRGGMNYSITWNGTDDNGKPVSSGVYFYKLKSGNYTSTKKMILMK